MVQHMLAELHDFRGAGGVETSDWVLQVCVTYVMVLRLQIGCPRSLRVSLCLCFEVGQGQMEQRVRGRKG